MKSLLIIFYIILSTNLVLAQKEDYKKTQTEFLLRAKALGFVIIEDRWVRSFSIGGEVRFNERFSVCADLVHFRWKFEKEVYPTPGNYEDYDEYALFDARNYPAFETRYYPRLLNSTFYRPYATVFTKLGARFLHIQDEYPPDVNEVIRLNSDFTDLGACLGLQFGGKFGFDVNMGIAHRFELKNEDIYLQNGEMQYTSRITDNKWNFAIRVNFYINLTN